MEARGFGDVRALAERWFSAAELGDVRRTLRLVESAERVMKQPGGTLPAKFSDPGALEGFYRLMSDEQVTHASVLGPAVAATWRAMAEHAGVVLILHDTTVLDYSGLSSVADLGQIGDGHGRGLYAHNSLAVTCQGRVLGLAGQLLHRRREVKDAESRADCQSATDRESRLWKRACEALPHPPSSARWVDVADRGSDVTEFLAHEHRAGRSYVIRSQHNRRVRVMDEHGEVSEHRLHDHIRGLMCVGQTRRTIDVPSAPGRRARRAELSVAWCALEVLPPRQRRGEHDDAPLSVWAVRVWEADPPAGAEPIEWVLLTNVAVNGETQAWERVGWYASRWKIEDYHKSLKTGLGIEQMQFTSRDRLEPAIAMLSVIGTWLVGLRDASRDPELHEKPASSLVPASWVRVLSAWRHRQVRVEWTLHEFVYALARLGGHQNRKSDHPPGWQTLWRGWIRLQDMLAGASLLDIRRCGVT